MVDHHQNKKYSKNGQYSIKYSYNGSNKTDSTKHNSYNSHSYATLTSKFAVKFFLATVTSPHNINHTIMTLSM